VRDKAGAPGGLQFKHGKCVFVPPDKLRASSSPLQAVPESQFNEFIPPVRALPAEGEAGVRAKGEAGVRGRGGIHAQYGGDPLKVSSPLKVRQLLASTTLSRFDFDKEDDQVRGMRQKYLDEVSFDKLNCSYES